LSEGLLAALPGYKGPDVKNNQKWLFRRRSADQPRSARRIACQIDIECFVDLDTVD